MFYKIYVNDIFVLFKRPEHVKLFVYYMSITHEKINSSFETEKDGQMPFLDVKLFRENSKFMTNVYSYLLLSFMGKMSALVKSGLIRSSHIQLPFCNVKNVYKTSNRLKNYFSFKDVVPQPLGIH